MAKGGKDFAEYFRTRTVKPPGIVYKYAPLCTARKILSSKKVRFSSPLVFNDPFDTQWDVLWQLGTPEAQRYQRTHIERLLCDPISWPPDASPKMRQAMAAARARINSLPAEQRESATREFLSRAVSKFADGESRTQLMRSTCRRMRVLCFSAIDDSVLMWSHYGDQHRGVVLGFDTAVLEATWDRPLEPVAYFDALPSIIDPEKWISAAAIGLRGSLKFDEDKERVWALSKHSGWQYEQEWRFALRSKKPLATDYDDVEIPKRALVEIVMGCRTTPEQATELLSLARTIQHDVQQYKMTPHPSRFALAKSDVATE